MVEDEYMVAKRLKRFVDAAFSDHIIKLTVLDSLDDADDYLASNHIDLLFLDLNLQGKDGFSLLKDKLCQSFHTIVVSANSERALEAFDLGVLDFIAKPFDQERVQKAVNRVLDNTQTGASKYLAYKRLGKTELLAVSEILYLKAEGHYTSVVTKSGESVLHDKNLDKLLITLPDNFFRIHRSYAVPLENVQSIESLEGSKYLLTLNDKTNLPIGRTRLALLKEQLY